MTTERNIERNTRANKIWAGLYGILGVWTTLVSAIIIATFKQSDTATIATYCGLISGPLLIGSIWLPIVFVQQLAIISVVFTAVDLSARRVGEKWLCINLITVSILAVILTYSVSYLALKQADNLQPLGRPFEVFNRYSRGNHPRSSTAFIFTVNGNNNNSIMHEPIPPPSYDSLSVHLSFVGNNEAPPAYSTERKPPPSYSSLANMDSAMTMYQRA